MIFLKYLIIIGLFILSCNINSFAQKDTNYTHEEEMTMESWQKQVDEYSAKKNELSGKIYDIDKSIDTLKILKKTDDSLFRKLQAEIYSLVDADSSQVNDFNDRFETTEKKILNELAPLSDIKEYWYNWISNNKIRLLKQFRTRYAIMKEKIDNWKDK